MNVAVRLELKSVVIGLGALLLGCMELFRLRHLFYAGPDPSFESGQCRHPFPFDSAAARGEFSLSFCAVMMVHAKDQHHHTQHPASSDQIRLLRTVRLFPNLAMIVETAIKSASSVVFIGMFGLLFTYMFAIVGVASFGPPRIYSSSSPFSFLSLHIRSLLTYPRLRCIATDLLCGST